MKLKPGRLTAIIKGAVASIGAMALYAISLGCFTALMLLIISMEEGGENLPTSAVPLTQAVILLSQGTGFVAGSVRVGVIPLLLPILLIALIAQCARKAGGGAVSWAVGLVAWVALNLMCANGTTFELADSPLVIAGRTALIWTIGYLLGTLPASGLIPSARDAFKARVDRRLYDGVALTLLLVAVLFLVAVVASLVVVIVWIARDWQGMATLFELDGMENGSRILTTIASCAWLPNLMIWAFSWLLGAGFHIGELGVFTLWVGQSASLPPLPVFGLMPEAVADDRIRLILQCIIPAVVAIIALLAMLLPGPMRIRPVAFGDDEGLKHLVVTMLCHLGAFAASALITIGLAAGGFALSDGPLGEQRLAHVGVDLLPSLEVVARALGFGFAVSWLAVTVVLAAVYGIHWIVEHHAGRRAPSPARSAASASATDDGKDDSQAAGDTQATSRRPAKTGPKEPGKPKESKADADTGTKTGAGSDRSVRSGGRRARSGEPKDHKDHEERKPRSIRSESASGVRIAAKSDAKPGVPGAADGTAGSARVARVAEGQAGRNPHPGRVVRSARSARSGGNGSPSKPAMKLDEQPSKEENDDNNQPSD